MRIFCRLILIILLIFCGCAVNYKQKIIDYSKAIEENPLDPTVYFKRGFAYQKINNYKPALIDYNKAIELNPEYTFAYNNRGNVQRELGNYKESIADYDKAIELNPQYVLAYYNRGKAHGKFRKYKEAIADFDKAIELNPKYTVAYYNRGLVQDKLGKYKESIKDYDKVIELNPKYTDAYNDRGIVYHKLGDYDSAIADYSKAIELRPKNALVYNNRALSQTKLRKYKEAIEDYSKVIELNPKFTDAYYNRGNIQKELGEYKEAVADYIKAIELNPKYTGAYYNRGIIYSIFGKYDKAIADHNKVIELYPQYAPAYINRGTVQRNIRKYKEAISDYNKAIELDQKEALVYINLAMLYATAKDKKFRNGQLAIKNAQKANELSNGNAMHLHTLAVVYAEIGDFKEAIAKQEEAITYLKTQNNFDTSILERYLKRLEYYKVSQAWSLSPAASSEKLNDTLSKIESLATSQAGDEANQPLMVDLIEKIKADPDGVTSRLLIRLKDSYITEQQLLFYIWALGYTKNQRAFEGLTKLYQENKSELVRLNCLQAIAEFSGTQAEDFILTTLEATSDKKKRFTLLNLLGQMQCERAIPKMEELLKLDPNRFYWQSVFVFGKMGDKAIPFLLTKVNDIDRNVRFNAINTLGRWLIAPEAAKPIEAQFWKEDVKELRILELSFLEKTIPDLDQMKLVFEDVIAKEKDIDLVRFARESLDMMNEPKFTVLLTKKKISTEAFEREYELLFKYAGKKGNYEILRTASSIKDEPKLKKLRERILQRNSDEAFYDYQKVNEIILLNRFGEHIYTTFKKKLL